MKTEVAQETMKAIPPVSVAGMALGGMTLSDAVMIATLIYIVLQGGYLLWKWRRDVKRAALEDKSMKQGG